MNQPLWAWSATELDLAFAAGDLLPSAVLEAVLARAEEANPEVNAIVLLDAEAARAKACQADERVRTRARLGPLDGVPFTIKDNLFWGGRRATWGSRLYGDFVPETSDVSIRALEAAGAIPFAKTNTPEFALAGITDNALFGTTRHPAFRDRTPGGSSGGAVAAVALGMGAFAIATDAGGSIRRPAGYCGLFGLRTALGDVPRRHGFPATATDFQTIGPIARTLADVRLVHAAIRGPNRTAPPAATGRIGLVLRGPGVLIEPEVETATLAVADRLRAAGYTVDTLDLPWQTERVDEAWAILTAASMVRLRNQHTRERWDGLVGESPQALASKGEPLDGATVVHALDLVRQVRAETEDAFAAVDLWLAPTSTCRAWPLPDPFPATIAGQPAGPRSASVHATIANVAGLFGLALPAPVTAGSLPVGVQLMAPAGREPLAFEAAEKL